ESVTSDASLKDALRTPLLLALFRVGFRDAPEDAHTLRDLSKGDFNNRIWDAFIDQRWAHEQARQPNVPLPYSAAELKHHLGKGLVKAMSGYRDDDARILITDIDVHEAGSVIALSQRLDLLRSAGDEPVGRGWEPYPSFRFLHLRLRDSLALPAALTALHDVDAEVRSYAAGTLGNLGDLRAVEPLIAALYDSAESVRSSAAGALGRLHDFRAVEPLIAALHDSAGSVRRNAAESLGELSHLHAVRPLIAALYDPNVYVLRRAAEALGKLGDPRAIEPLIAALHDPDVRVQGSIALALGKLGEPAIEPLIAALRDPDVFVHNSAALVLRLYNTDHPVAQAAVADFDAGKIKPRWVLSYFIIHFIPRLLVALRRRLRR
ncbi:MAG: HEAT repeat domain-containing protein, partial [Anaerolineae bacterium]|nr:HEAT repeat domain-containing protein [Anaerolineae bacterium]